MPVDRHYQVSLHQPRLFVFEVIVEVGGMGLKVLKFTFEGLVVR